MTIENENLATSDGFFDEEDMHGGGAFGDTNESAIFGPYTAEDSDIKRSSFVLDFHDAKPHPTPNIPFDQRMRHIVSYLDRHQLILFVSGASIYFGTAIYLKLSAAPMRSFPWWGKMLYAPTVVASTTFINGFCIYQLLNAKIAAQMIDIASDIWFSPRRPVALKQLVSPFLMGFDLKHFSKWDRARLISAETLSYVLGLVAPILSYLSATPLVFAVQGSGGTELESEFMRWARTLQLYISYMRARSKLINSIVLPKKIRDIMADMKDTLQKSISAVQKLKHDDPNALSNLARWEHRCHASIYATIHALHEANTNPAKSPHSEAYYGPGKHHGKLALITGGSLSALATKARAGALLSTFSENGKVTGVTVAETIITLVSMMVLYTDYLTGAFGSVYPGNFKREHNPELTKGIISVIFGLMSGGAGFAVAQKSAAAHRIGPEWLMWVEILASFLTSASTNSVFLFKNTQLVGSLRRFAGSYYRHGRKMDGLPQKKLFNSRQEMLLRTLRLMLDTISSISNLDENTLTASAYLYARPQPSNNDTLTPQDIAQNLYNLPMACFPRHIIETFPEARKSDIAAQEGHNPLFS